MSLSIFYLLLHVGHLLTRFAEKGFSYRITKNPIEGSIFWKMDVPDEVAQVVCVLHSFPCYMVVNQEVYTTEVM